MSRNLLKERKNTLLRRSKRLRRVRCSLRGTPARPRLTVFRSLKHIAAQLVDDQKGRTLLSVSDTSLKSEEGLSKLKIAEKVGSLLAEKALEKGIQKAVFDRGFYLFHGRVRSLAEGARQKGLSF